MSYPDLLAKVLNYSEERQENRQKEEARKLMPERNLLKRRQRILLRK